MQRRRASRDITALLVFIGGLGSLGAHGTAQAAGPAVVATPPLVAAPGDDGPSADKRAKAKALFDEGAALYTQGSYEEAIAKWERAYELSEEPLIFENMANAYERLGDLKQAYEHLSLWRQTAPPEEHATLDKRLKNLEERIARKEREAKPEKKPVEKPKKPAMVDRGPGVSIPGLILTSVGLAAVAGGVAVGVVAAGQRPDEETVCVPYEDRSLCRESSRDAIGTSTTLAAVSDLMWIAGAVTGTVGVVLLLTYEPERAPAVGAALRPTVGLVEGAGAAGLSLEGTW